MRTHTLSQQSTKLLIILAKELISGTIHKTNTEKGFSLTIKNNFIDLNLSVNVEAFIACMA